ncbi:hypothetical protein [Haloarcula sp. Atlit-47R]|uniref:hypothetical protein n=1 Tax=Haloarcula sp. Atlit-47R TaxID=2282132 RepID=UPI0011C473BE|nr:hypothetical protein [Haloarcula sp. Atlit-47R]
MMRKLREQRTAHENPPETREEAEQMLNSLPEAKQKQYERFAKLSNGVDEPVDFFIVVNCSGTQADHLAAEVTDRFQAENND